MKQSTTTSLVATILVVMLGQSLTAQVIPRDRPVILKKHLLEGAGPVSMAYPSARPLAPLGYARYTTKDWRRLIDSVWGPGLPTSEKLQIFDDFWSAVDRYHGGFVNNSINWDSLRNVYRPEIAQGVSRGRFGAIMSHLGFALHEIHTWIYDNGMDSALATAGYFRPRGVPMLIPFAVGRSGLGVSLTPLPDSSLLVIEAQSSHPLGLKAGDIILGYDRVPWKQLIRQLLDAQLPISIGYSSIWGSSDESSEHILLTTAASSWHLFDSLDVVKYPAGDTAHISLSGIIGWTWDKLKACEQLPVKGVPMPVFNIGSCTGGVVEGTNVGYIYIRDWYSDGIADKVRGLIDNLTQTAKVNGLILDFRVNFGGDESNLASLASLFNSDPYRWYSLASRTSTTDRLAFTVAPNTKTLAPKDQFFDHPIAVLTGPECLSAGDYGAFFMRSHPMVRFFGLPTNMAYVVEALGVSSYPGNFWSCLSAGSVYSHYPGEGYLLHKGFDVDERVWFTRDDVAKGDDSVVKRALEWIAGLAYAHGATLSKVAAKPGQDSIKVTAIVENPQTHTLTAWSYVTDSHGRLVDSCEMLDDGLHGDGAAGDRMFGGSFRTPAVEGMFGVSPRTRDVTAGTYRHLTDAKRLFTNGPVVSQGWASTTSDTVPNPGDMLRLKFRLANNGKADTVRSVTATVRALDTLVTISAVQPLSFGDLAPGREVLGDSIQALKILSTCPPNTRVRLLLNIAAYGTPVWTDTVSILVLPSMTGVAGCESVPTEYYLSQNYPNPFNPSTTIGYGLPERSLVSIAVYNTLGQQVAQLVNGEIEAGFHEARFDASALPSGVYFYRMQTRQSTDGQAREIVSTRKFLLLK
jgi:hypothetical protein